MPDEKCKDKGISDVWMEGDNRITGPLETRPKENISSTLLSN
jgi:hypothetical protein